MEKIYVNDLEQIKFNDVIFCVLLRFGQVETTFPNDFFHRVNKSLQHLNPLVFKNNKVFAISINDSVAVAALTYFYDDFENQPHGYKKAVNIMQSLYLENKVDLNQNMLAANN